MTARSACWPSPTWTTTRYDTLFDADFRLAKTGSSCGKRMSLSSRPTCSTRSTRGTILGRNRQANSSAFGTPTDMLSPRILRLGARFNF